MNRLLITLTLSLFCMGAVAESNAPEYLDSLTFSDRLQQFGEKMRDDLDRGELPSYTDEQQARLDSCNTEPRPSECGSGGGMGSLPSTLGMYMGVSYAPAGLLPIMLLKPDLERIGAWGHDNPMVIGQALPEIFNIQVIPADYYVEFELPATTLLDITLSNSEGTMMGVQARMELRDGAYYFASVNEFESDMEMAMITMPQAKKGSRRIVMELDSLEGFTFPDTKMLSGNAVIWNIRYGQVRVDTGWIFAGRWQHDWYPTEQSGFLRGTLEN